MTISFTNWDFLQFIMCIGLYCLLVLLLSVVLIFHIIFAYKALKLLNPKIEINKSTAENKKQSLMKTEFNTNDYDDIKHQANSIIKNLTTIQEAHYEDVAGIKKDVEISINFAKEILKKFDNETDEGEHL